MDGRQRDEGKDDIQRSVALVAMAILALCLFPAASGYGQREFLAAYKDPTVSRHEVMGDVILSASLPALTRDLTLVGVRGNQGQLPVIDGRSRFSGINLTSPGAGGRSLTLTDLEFRNFRSKGVKGGAAVYVEVETRLRIDGCVFRGNKAPTGGGGGAITLDESSFAEISNSRFERNEARGWGGAVVFFIDASGDIRRTSFKDNYSRSRGGAITASEGQVVIDGCAFQGNREDGGGGGGAVACDDTVCIVSNSSFTGNVAKGNGGALWFYDDQEGGGTICRGNRFSGNNAAKDAKSNNIYIQAPYATSPEFRFCDRKAPPRTLINATLQAVVFNDCSSC